VALRFRPFWLSRGVSKQRLATEWRLLAEFVREASAANELQAQSLCQGSAKRAISAGGRLDPSACRAGERLNRGRAHPPTR
jgi:hypothetical protein